MLTLLDRPNPMPDLRPRLRGAARNVLAELRGDREVARAWRDAEHVAERPLNKQPQLRLRHVPAPRIPPIPAVTRDPYPASPSDIPQAAYRAMGLPMYLVELPFYLRAPYPETPENADLNASWQLRSFEWMRENVFLGHAIKLTRAIGSRDTYAELMKATVDMIGIGRYYAQEVRRDFAEAFGTALPSERESGRRDDVLWISRFFEWTRGDDRPLTVARGMALLRP